MHFFREDKNTKMADNAIRHFISKTITFRYCTKTLYDVLPINTT